MSTTRNASSRKKIMTQATSPKMFGPYAIYDQIGAGGMGAVYRAFDTKLQRPVAIKIITGQGITQSEVKRFLREARAMAQLDHENIVKIYDTGISPTPFIAMEYIEGSNLSTLIKMSKINTEQLIKVIIETSNALSITHKAGIIHRDIKPANIMITNNQVAKLMDFGLAKIDEDQQLSQSGSVIGTPAYMAPEQVQGIVKPTNDIYSLGAVLYEGLTGRPPFEGETSLNILAQIVMEEPIPPRDLNPDISIYLEAISLKCLQKKASKRYSSAEELADDLRNFQKNRPITAKPYTRIDRAKKFILRNKAFSIGIAIFVVALLSFCIVLDNKNQSLDQANKNLSTTIEKLQLEKSNKGDICFQTFDYAMDLVDFQSIVKNPALADKFTQYMMNIEKLGPENLFTKDKQIAKAYFTALLFTSSPQEKAQQYSAIIEKQPFILVLKSRIEAYIILKMYDKAWQDCLTIRQLNSNIKIVHLLQAQVLYYQKKYAEALDEIQKGFSSEDQDRSHRIRGSIYMKLHNYSQAIEDLTIAIQMRKEDVLAYRHRGDSYFALKKYQEAIKDYEKVIGINPKATNPYLALAEAYEQLGDKDNELKAYIARGNILFEKQAYTQAIGSWRKAIKITKKKSPERKKLRAKIRKAQELKK